MSAVYKILPAEVVEYIVQEELKVAIGYSREEYHVSGCEGELELLNSLIRVHNYFSPPNEHLTFEEEKK